MDDFSNNNQIYKNANEEKKNNYNNNPINGNKNEKVNQIFIKNEEQHIDVLNEEEIIKAKNNSFILIGKTGVGKTSLLNIIYGKDIGKVGHSSLSETQNCNYYCIKEKANGQNIYFCIIDTPGLYDTKGFKFDEKQKREIMELISKENLKIKGLLFLSNFQNERFDASEQNALIDYIKMFPLKEFWQRIIFIYTHYYGDPNSYTKEEIKENNNIYKSEIIHKLMLNVKKVCVPVKFEDLDSLYINIYNKRLNDKKIKNNLEIRKELISKIFIYIKLTPMFNRLQIFTFENYEFEENDKYLYNCDLYIYLDFSNNIIHQEFHINNRIEKKLGIDKKQNIKINIVDCDSNEEGQLFKKTTKKEGFEEIFNNYKGEIGRGLTILSLICIVCSSIFCLSTLPAPILSLLGGAILWNKNKTEKEEERKRIEEIIIKEKIIELIKNELNKYKY
jgi:GTP-binding protein EngB required for normal cell division